MMRKYQLTVQGSTSPTERLTPPLDDLSVGATARRVSRILRLAVPVGAIDQERSHTGQTDEQESAKVESHA